MDAYSSLGESGLGASRRPFGAARSLRHPTARRPSIVHPPITKGKVYG